MRGAKGGEYDRKRTRELIKKAIKEKENENTRLLKRKKEEELRIKRSQDILVTADVLSKMEDMVQKKEKKIESELGSSKKTAPNSTDQIKQAKQIGEVPFSYEIKTKEETLVIETPSQKKGTVEVLKEEEKRVKQEIKIVKKLSPIVKETKKKVEQVKEQLVKIEDQVASAIEQKEIVQSKEEINTLMKELLELQKRMSRLKEDPLYCDYATAKEQELSSLISDYKEKTNFEVVEAFSKQCQKEIEHLEVLTETLTTGTKVDEKVEKKGKEIQERDQKFTHSVTKTNELQGMERQLQEQIRTQESMIDQFQRELSQREYFANYVAYRQNLIAKLGGLAESTLGLAILPLTAFSPTGFITSMLMINHAFCTMNRSLEKERDAKVIDYYQSYQKQLQSQILSMEELENILQDSYDQIHDFRWKFEEQFHDVIDRIAEYQETYQTILKLEREMDQKKREMERIKRYAEKEKESNQKKLELKTDEYRDNYS